MALFIENILLEKMAWRLGKEGERPLIRISLNKAEREKLIKLREGGISEHSEKILMVLLSDQVRSPVDIPILNFYSCQPIHQNIIR